MYEFAYQGGNPLGQRTRHIRRALQDGESGETLVLMGREWGPLGSAAAPAWLAQAFLAFDTPGAEEAMARVLDSGAPGPEVAVLDLAFATAALAGALENRRLWGDRKEGPPLAGRPRAAILEAISGLASALAARQHDDGTWGGSVETAWSLYAMMTAVDAGKAVQDRTGEEWRKAGPGILAQWSGPDPPEGTSTVDRLHRAAAVSLAQRLFPGEGRGPDSAWFQRQFRGLDPGDDPDAWFAAGFLWFVLGPSADPDHPLQGCKGLLWASYSRGGFRARSAGETLALAAAIESFGWDSFGSVIGYLPVSDWPPHEDR